MENLKPTFCKVCSSSFGNVINSYKHYCFVCDQCNSVSHYKKERCLGDIFLPKRFLRRALPPKAYLRLFSDSDLIENSEFYSDDAFDTSLSNEWRQSEQGQFKDQLFVFNLDVANKAVLDLSGGPGTIAETLSELGANVTVTEFGQSEVQRMNDKLKSIKAFKFDYNNDSLQELFPNSKFDIVLIRSSLIFCEDLNAFLEDLKGLLNNGSYVVIETIVPSLGEVLWWQQLEFKFPVIYSRPQLESTFHQQGLGLISSREERGAYYGVKIRSYKDRSRRLFVRFVELPLVIFYWMRSFFGPAAIDKSMDHKMITQLYKLGSESKVDRTFVEMGPISRSKTFAYTYNGFLKNDKK